MFDDIIADMESNKRLRLIVTELLLRGIKVNISLVFISQSYFKVPKFIKQNATHDFILKIGSKKELEQIVSSHSSEIDCKGFVNLHKDYPKKPCSFLVNDVTLSSDNLLIFSKKLL